MQLCHRIDAQPLAGMIVIGDGQAARAVALSGNSMKIPVLWAKGGTANLKDGNREVSANQSGYNTNTNPSDTRYNLSYDYVHTCKTKK